MNLELLKHPITVVIGMVLGIVIGIFFKPLTPYLSPFGSVYLSLLNLCVLPIIVTSLIGGFAQLIYKHRSEALLGRLLTVLMSGILLTGTIAIVVMLLGSRFVKLDADTTYRLGQNIQAIELYPSDSNVTPTLMTHPSFHLKAFLELITPNNLFRTLSGEVSLQLILVTLLIGVSFGKIVIKDRKTYLNFLSIFNQIFTKIFNWLVYFLPFGLCCLLVDKVQLIDIAWLGSLIKLIILIYVECFIVFVLATAIVSWLDKRPFWVLFGMFKKTNIISFIMGSAFIAMPSAIESLKKQSLLSKEIIDLTFPLGITINRLGNVLLLIIVSIFVAEMYHIHLDVTHIVLIFILVVLAGSSAQGGGALFQSSFNVIAVNVGLPLAPAMLILTLIDPFVHGILSFLTVYLNCLQNLIISKKMSLSHERRGKSDHG